MSARLGAAARVVSPTNAPAAMRPRTVDAFRITRSCLELFDVGNPMPQKPVPAPIRLTATVSGRRHVSSKNSQIRPPATDRESGRYDRHSPIIRPNEQLHPEYPESH